MIRDTHTPHTQYTDTLVASENIAVFAHLKTANQLNPIPIGRMGVVLKEQLNICIGVSWMVVRNAIQKTNTNSAPSADKTSACEN